MPLLEKKAKKKAADGKKKKKKATTASSESSESSRATASMSHSQSAGSSAAAPRFVVHVAPDGGKYLWRPKPSEWPPKSLASFLSTLRYTLLAPTHSPQQRATKTPTPST